MSKAKIRQRIVNVIVAELGVDVDDVTESADLVDDLRADSLDIVEVAMSLEDEFDLAEIPADIGGEWRTVQDIFTHIEGRKDLKKSRVVIEEQKMEAMSE